MAKKSCMGTVLQQDIATVYTAVAQVLSVSASGRGDKTFEATTLDSASDNQGVVWSENIQTGIADPGKIAFELFLDPALTGHQDIVGRIGQGNTMWKVVYPNSGGAFDGFTSSGLTYTVDVKVGDGLKMSVDLTLTGPVTQFSGSVTN